MYILVNGHIVKETNEFLWPRSGCELNIVIVTCKHRGTLSYWRFDSLVASLVELLNFNIDNNKLSEDYNQEVLDTRIKFLDTYKKVSPRLQKFTFEIYYASRGDSKEVEKISYRN